MAFGLAYAGTARAVTNSADGQRYDTLFAAGAAAHAAAAARRAGLGRAGRARQITQPDGVLPLRGLAIGAVLSVLVAAGAGAVGAVLGAPRHARPPPARVPPLDQTKPLTPVSFVAGLRPADPDSKGTPRCSS